MLKKSENKTLAIITPVYNTECYLRQFLLSIQNQKFDNFDIYLIDDGSTDESLNILNEFASKDSRFYVIHKNNSGPSSARNKGLEAVQNSKYKYKYIYFCDSDDFLLEDTLYEVIKELDENIADYGLFSVCYVKKNSVTKHRMNVRKNTKMSHIDIVKQYFRMGYKWRKEPCSEAFLNNKVFRSDILNGQYFDEKIKRAEDFDFFFRILPKLNKGVLIPNAWYMYRRRKSSLTNAVKESGDTYVCKKHLPALPNRSKLEQIAMQHRLLRSLYLRICHSIEENNTSEAMKIKREIMSLKFKYPLYVGDMKIILIAHIPDTFFWWYFSCRNSNMKITSKKEDYFD